MELRSQETSEKLEQHAQQLKEGVQERWEASGDRHRGAMKKYCEGLSIAIPCSTRVLLC